MDTSQVTRGQMIAAAGGAVLIISLFFDWVSGFGSLGGGSAFDVFSGMDIILLIVGVIAVAPAVMSATGAGASFPVEPGELLAFLGVGALGWALGWDLENPDAGIGAWLGLLGAIAILYGGLQVRSDH